MGLFYFEQTRTSVIGEHDDYEHEVVEVLTKYESGDRVKKKSMRGTCSTYGDEEWWVQGYGGEP